MRRALPPLLLLAPLLGGCVVHAVYDVATAPVRATSWTYDRLTTSQAEADRTRGRRARKAEEKAARDQRRLEREQRRAARQQRREEAGD